MMYGILHAGNNELEFQIYISRKVHLLLHAFPKAFPRHPFDEEYQNTYATFGNTSDLAVEHNSVAYTPKGLVRLQTLVNPIREDRDSADV